MYSEESVSDTQSTLSGSRAKFDDTFSPMKIHDRIEKNIDGTSSTIYSSVSGLANVIPVNSVAWYM